MCTYLSFVTNITTSTTVGRVVVWMNLFCAAECYIRLGIRTLVCTDTGLAVFSASTIVTTSTAVGRVVVWMNLILPAVAVAECYIRLGIRTFACAYTTAYAKSKIPRK